MPISTHRTLAGQSGVAALARSTFLEAPVEALNQPIALRMVGSGLLVGDVHRAADSTPQARGELGTSFRRDDVWHAKTCHPFIQQFPGACSS